MRGVPLTSVLAAALLTICFVFAVLQNPGSRRGPSNDDSLLGAAHQTTPPADLKLNVSAQPTPEATLGTVMRTAAPLSDQSVGMQMKPIPVPAMLATVPAEGYTTVNARRRTPVMKGAPRDAPHTSADMEEAVAFRRRCPTSVGSGTSAATESQSAVCDDFLAAKQCFQPTGIGGKPAPVGNWTALYGCAWGTAAAHIPLLTKFKMQLPSPKRRCGETPGCACWRHSRGPSTEKFKSKEWARDILVRQNQSGPGIRPLLFFGHSHQRRLFFTTVLALQDLFPYVRIVYPAFDRADAVAWICTSGNGTDAVPSPSTAAPRRCTPTIAAAYVPTTNPAADGLDYFKLLAAHSLKSLDVPATVNHSTAPFPGPHEREAAVIPQWAAAAAIVVVGRGMWDLEHADAGPEWVRATHAPFLVAAYRFFGPNATVVAYLTHFVHTTVGGCMSPARQVQFRDAVRCAVDTANAELEAASQVRVLDVFDLTATRAVDFATLGGKGIGSAEGPPHFLSPTDVLQQLPRPRPGGKARRAPYINPEAVTLGLMPLGDGHHYDAPLLFSVFVRLLEVAAAPAMPDRVRVPNLPVSLADVPSLPRAAGRYCGPCRTCTAGFPGGLFLGTWCEELRLRMAMSAGDPVAAALRVPAKLASENLHRHIFGAEKAGKAPRFSWVTHTLLAAMEAERAIPFDNRTACPP